MNQDAAYLARPFLMNFVLLFFGIPSAGLSELGALRYRGFLWG